MVSTTPMDWPKAVERNRVALLRIVGALFVMLGWTDCVAPDRIPRALHRAILRILRPAESAVRRLIVILAKDIVVKPQASRPVPKESIKSKGGTKRPPNFALFDPRKRFDHQRKPRRNPAKFGPRIWVLGDELPALIPSRPEPDGFADTRRLKDRLQAIMKALEDLPKQANRLARALARRDKVPSLRLKDPMRPGRAPGYRKKITHEVDEILRDCHGLAWDATWSDTT